MSDLASVPSTNKTSLHYGFPFFFLFCFLWLSIWRNSQPTVLCSQHTGNYLLASDCRRDSLLGSHHRNTLASGHLGRWLWTLMWREAQLMQPNFWIHLKIKLLFFIVGLHIHTQNCDFMKSQANFSDFWNIFKLEGSFSKYILLAVGFQMLFSWVYTLALTHHRIVVVFMCCMLHKIKRSS